MGLHVRTIPGIGMCANLIDAACYCPRPARFSPPGLGIIQRRVQSRRIRPKVWHRYCGSVLFRLWTVSARDDSNGRCTFPAIAIYRGGCPQRIGGRNEGTGEFARLQACASLNAVTDIFWEAADTTPSPLVCGRGGVRSEFDKVEGTFLHERERTSD